MNFVIINETHDLFPQQIERLNEFGAWERVDVPADGWTLSEQINVADELRQHIASGSYIIFASPVPALLKMLAERHPESALVFHNDSRQKKTLPNGRVISTVAETGWVLV